ncbi:uncharacterized protein LOC116852590 [Odontomachus brunneus]|uniref:uncharacterized protein LOC116852590 n=1 Tax=Odontomachus brunneus TaxID=486640 RepID=UPI0013F22007|nr:uncharacterized protein LOC116852590 [Odontomachus brunneus]
MDQQQPSSSSGIEKKKRKCVRNKFQYEWLSMNIFKDWLASHENDEKALCTACNKILICGKSNLISHSKTGKHVENMKSRNITLSVLLPVKHNNIYVDHVTKVKIAEIKLAAFYATHNIAFEVVNDMVPLLKNIFTDSQIAKDLTLSRTKCRQIITNILAKHESEKLINNLLNNKFSILLDESTSITNDKMLCILVKYFSIENKTVITQLLELVSLDATDCSAEKLYSAFEQCFKSKRIPMSNIVGMASDNASVMIGDNNSFKSRLKKEVPALIVLKCICHSSALIASKACAKLPDSSNIMEKQLKCSSSDISENSEEQNEELIMHNVDTSNVDHGQHFPDICNTDRASSNAQNNYQSHQRHFCIQQQQNIEFNV